MNWTEARKWCQRTYTDMVVIQNQRENDYLVSLLPNRNMSPYFWIGITKNQKNETWTWIGNNSTWIGEQSWAANEPNNNHIKDFCVEIYVNTGVNRGKWNDEKCTNLKSPVCYEAQCTATSCDRGRCQETIGNITCLCEPGFTGNKCQTAQCTAMSCNRGRCQETIDNITCLCEPGFTGNKCQTAVECPPLSQPGDGYLNCSGEKLTFNSTCWFKCYPGFLITGSQDVTCGVTGVWSGPRPFCASYKQALLAVVGCVAVSAFCCVCFCWMKRRKRKEVAQVRQPEETTSPSTEALG
ncbi:L-selectin-like isoform X2 [Pseudoliparis swirei]|uniref:L-selectin-like isoform X2 n=1 Tax=Pseudoliparis swirei TaxID=2059687 RepID=UPI0024BEC1E6|nr:L-selectin-like isoform X2 [Pseudoliparis swirei]